jgi:hypothetical protein
MLKKEVKEKIKENERQNSEIDSLSKTVETLEEIMRENAAETLRRSSSFASPCTFHRNTVERKMKNDI